MDDHAETALICHRCSALLTAGEGSFYIVRIEAFADPTPPHLDGDEFADLDPGAEINRAIEQMHGMTERELMDQVHRRLTIHLCSQCYEDWIEDPAK